MLVTCLKCSRHVHTGPTAAADIVTCACGMGILVPEGPRSAGKMSCPSCGAPIDPDLKRCTYCDTRLATVMCPRCFGAVFDGARHCPHCGEELSGRVVIHHGDETEHVCPRCEDHPKLRVEVVAGYPLERCPECEGLWVDCQTVEKVYKDREQSEVVGKMTRARGAPPVTSDLVLKPEGYIRCPVCRKMMNRQNFGRFSGVIIDICKNHGTWFDPDELRRILEFIASGGLDKAAEREKMELKEEIRWLKQKRALEASSDRMSGGDMMMGYGGIGSRRRFEAEGFALGIGGLLRSLFR